MRPVGVRGVMGVMLPAYPLERERWSLEKERGGRRVGRRDEEGRKEGGGVQ